MTACSLTILSNRLRPKGVETVVAHDAIQALMYAMRSPPDVIVLDIQMPGGTGIEALRKLGMIPLPGLRAPARSDRHPPRMPTVAYRNLVGADA